MDKFAIVKDGVVVNVIEYPSHPGNPPPGFENGHIAILADKVSPGWHYVDGSFIDPNPPVEVPIPSAPSLADTILQNPEQLDKLITMLNELKSSQAQ